MKEPLRLWMPDDKGEMQLTLLEDEHAEQYVYLDDYRELESKLPRWRKVDDEPPPPHERVLTLMKHGMISGCYDPESGTFGSYYWRHMEWFATYWMPLPEPPQ